MPKLVEHGLSAVRVKQEKRPGRYADGNGLYLMVAAAGTKSWAWRGLIHGTGRVEVGMGPTRFRTLAEAREVAHEWSKLARGGGDPRKVRDAGKRKVLTFAEAAERVHAEQIDGHVRNPKHAAQWISTLRTYAFPAMGEKALDRITQADVKAALLPIWTTIPETARRVRQRISTVLDWATTEGHREGVNPAAGVEKALPRVKRAEKGHHAMMDWPDVPAFMRRVEAAEGMGALALRFAILTAARSGEVRGARWSEIDLDERRWTIPAERMKAGRPHVVPLSDGAMNVLAALGKPGKADELVFPSKHKDKPLSDMTLAAVLKRLEVPVTVHGFRASFRTWADEATAYPHAVKETALAHEAGQNSVEKAYLRSDLFSKRIELMNEWNIVISS